VTTDKPPEYLHVKPLEDDADCEIHNWPTEGLPKRLVQAMRATHPKGVNACRDCIDRATDEANRQLETGCILCARGIDRSPRGVHGYQGKHGMYDVACPATPQAARFRTATIPRSSRRTFPLCGSRREAPRERATAAPLPGATANAERRARV
jgi:hypothetical protein